MKAYSIKEVAEILKNTENKQFSQDAIRKMVRENRLPIPFKKLGWQVVLFAENEQVIIDSFRRKFQRVKNLTLQAEVE